MKKILCSLALVFLASCAHQSAVDKKVTQEVQNEPAVAPGGSLAMESRKIIDSSPELNPSQKEKLLALHARVAGDVAAMRTEEGKLKMVFFRSILNPKTSDPELANIKSRILALERKKTERMLSAMEEAREILGRRSLQDDRVYRAFSMDRPSMGGDFF